MKLKEWNNLNKKQKESIEFSVYNDVVSWVKEMLQEDSDVVEDRVTQLGTINLTSILPTRVEFVIAIEDAIMFRTIKEEDIIDRKAVLPEEKVSKEAFDKIVLQLIEENRESIIQKILLQNVK